MDRLTRRDDEPSRGLVLGGGGTLGAAWTIGALTALHEELGFDPRTARWILGTSAGSILAALIGAGASPADLWRHQQGEPVVEGPLVGQVFDYDNAAGGAAPPRPLPGIGSPRLIARSMRHPGRYPTMAVISAFLPPGRGSLSDVSRMVEEIIPSGGWSAHPGVRTIAMDYDTGERVVFGEPDAPRADLAEAVVASCSIPGWFPPAQIGDRRYVDGGAVSNTSLDLLAADRLPGGEPLDEVYVVAPMAARGYDRPTGMMRRLERGFRHRVTRRMLLEAKQVRAGGTRVIVLCPGPEDLESLGANLMDPSRRAEVLATARRTTTEFLGLARSGAAA
jgi:NTE family protein